MTDARVGLVVSTTHWVALVVAEKVVATAERAVPPVVPDDDLTPLSVATQSLLTQTYVEKGQLHPVRH